MAHAPAASTVVRPRWYTHGFNRAALYQVGALVAGALPRRARLRVAVVVADVAATHLRAERRVVSGNVTRILPALTPDDHEALVTDVFRNFAICFADLITANRREPTLRQLLAGVEGVEHLDAAVRGGRGLVVLTAHVGNWELAGRILALRSPRPIHVVVAAEADPGVERFLRSGASPVRFVTLTQPTTVLPLVSALRRGEIVAMQGDRALGNRGDVLIPFFGAATRFPLGPFLLARAAGVPLVPAFCVLGRDRRYTITCGELIEVRRDGEREALERWVGVLERAVWQHPEQWFNFFDVWGDAPAY